MWTQITDNILISVEPVYLPQHSKASERKFIFQYQIKIENQGTEAVQLLKRHWYIFDSSSEHQEVKGEGVIGEQPIIHPNQFHEYHSFCQLSSDMGMMWGTYLMKRMQSDEFFEVKIPEFQLIASHKLN